MKYLNAFWLPAYATITSETRSVVRDAVIGLVLWAMGSLLLFAGEGGGELVLYWSFLSLSGVLLYSLFGHKIIPVCLHRKRPFWAYVLRAALTLVLTAVPVGLLVGIVRNDPEAGAGYVALHVPFQLLITTPLAWLVYQRRTRGQRALEGLQQELGQSNASLDLLRAQINPHFLFNALNTLYGTALQEQSERTAQGIQMLGDMMRFMLHENHQSRILLAREIEYLRNYIELQSLRIAASPNITLETSIEEVPEAAWIAPMLLIPFVENAFKHGISLQRRSWIKTTLHYANGKLYFDVYNSTHPRAEPEQLAAEESGLGLSNVQQRLALLYPKRHELIIRETSSEFFVHLTLQL
ncbi:sensor histidine kinase [Hymenobacter latericus]|uniref:sensor histidine kinase n=1 Tax=Hymenobacter sp. YIM 151858-1 TaxID=2987688 RepID=UPI0022263BE1|nr:histidine kinase [Hymenobacter sp. YIM 151858-1]UYZ57618.1 histidine kinase [Hymenobacter sp. YIM 151858-1]